METNLAQDLAETQTQEGTEVEIQEEPQAQTSDPKEVIIEVQNPSPEEMAELCKHIKVNHNFKVDVKEVPFNFKRTKDKETGIVTDRRPVNLAIAYPSIEGLIEIFEKGEKGLELFMEAVESTINAVVRDLLLDDTTPTAATFPMDKITWQAIAEMPKAQRRGGGIPKETWEEFCKDYCEIMPAVTGKKLEQVVKAAKLLIQKLAPCKTNEPVLNLLQEQLAIYADSSENYPEYEECVKFLLGKIETFLNISPEELIASL